MTNTQKIKDFVILPRQIVNDLRAGKITPQEFLLLCYLRGSGNPFGKTVTSLDDVRADLFRDRLGRNYCNKLFISLKSKRFIFYRDRQGRRGSFDVEMGNWILPNKAIKTLDEYFDPPPVRTEEGRDAVPRSEVSQKSGVANQKYRDGKKQLVKQFSANGGDEKIRGP